MYICSPSALSSASNLWCTLGNSENHPVQSRVLSVQKKTEYFPIFFRPTQIRQHSLECCSGIDCLFHRNMVLWLLKLNLASTITFKNGSFSFTLIAIYGYDRLHLLFRQGQSTTSHSSGPATTLAKSTNIYYRWNRPFLLLKMDKCPLWMTLSSRTTILSGRRWRPIPKR